MGSDRQPSVMRGNELQIVQAKVPLASERLSGQITRFVQELRTRDIYKIPGVAETIDWTTALVALDQDTLDERIVEETLGVILKYQDDIKKISAEEVRRMLQKIQSQESA